MVCALTSSAHPRRGAESPANERLSARSRRRRASGLERCEQLRSGLALHHSCVPPRSYETLSGDAHIPPCETWPQEFMTLIRPPERPGSALAITRCGAARPCLGRSRWAGTLAGISTARSLAVVLLLIAGCAGADNEVATTVPSNATLSLGVAVERLRAAGLRFEIADFPPQPQGVGLEGYHVRFQYPRAPARVARGSTVNVFVSSSPIPMFGSPVRHPPTVVVPRLIGLKYTQARARIPAGLWLQLGSVPPLPPDASVNGLDAFAIAQQSPKPGTVVPYSACATRGGGCRVSTLRIDLRLAG